jgi:hypothetical protein
MQLEQSGRVCSMYRPRAVLVPLRLPDDQLMPVEIDVLDSQSAALHEPQTAAVHQARHEAINAVRAMDRFHKATYLVARKDNLEPACPVRWA